ncbi:MAG: hypothetical protein GEU83_15825 [Pseudonocardiaceae bacterium]|nr:hypothetical protein [Pseudonocardiaceae bacterium]
MTELRDPILNLHQSFPLAAPTSSDPQGPGTSPVRPFALRFTVPVVTVGPEPTYRYERMQVNVDDTGVPVCKHRERPTSVRREVETHPDGGGPNPPPPDKTVVYDPD